MHIGANAKLSAPSSLQLLPSLKETLLARVARIPGEGADAAYLRHWVDNESQRLVDLLHEVFKSLPD